MIWSIEFSKNISSAVVQGGTSSVLPVFSLRLLAQAGRYDLTRSPA